MNGKQEDGQSVLKTVEEEIKSWLSDVMIVKQEKGWKENIVVGKKVDQIQKEDHVIHINVNLIGFWESGKTVLLPVEIQVFNTGNNVWFISHEKGRIYSTYSNPYSSILTRIGRMEQNRMEWTPYNKLKLCWCL